MSGRFKIPYSVRMPEPVNAICLAVCVAGFLEGKRKVLELEGQRCEGGKSSILGRGPFIARGWALFLLASGSAAAELSFHAAYVDHAVGKVSARTGCTMEGTKYKARVRKSMKMEKRIGEMPADREETQAEKVPSAEKDLLGMNGFRAFTETMNPEMRIESTSFDSEGPCLQVVVSTDHSEDVSTYMERVEHSGIFRQVGHSLREKSTKGRETEWIYVTVYGTLGMGGQDEAQ